VRLTPRETAVLRRRLEGDGGRGLGIDVPAVMQFFGRDGHQRSTAADLAGHRPKDGAPGDAGIGKSPEEKPLSAAELAEDEEGREAAEVEVGQPNRAEIVAGFAGQVSGLNALEQRVLRPFVVRLMMGAGLLSDALMCESEGREPGTARACSDNPAPAR